jgi:hypothetical protein
MTRNTCAIMVLDLWTTRSRAGRAASVELAIGLAAALVARGALAQSPESVGEPSGSAPGASSTPAGRSAGGEPSDPSESSRFHLTVGADVTTEYFFRGILQEDSGFILQPYADLSLDIIRTDEATVSLKCGTWNSFHDEATLASTDDSFLKKWYESDLYAGVGMVAGRWSFDVRYIFYTSPSDAFGTVEELDLSAAFDDTSYMGTWALKPSVTLAIETGSNAADGGTGGTYLQLGVSPGFAFDAGRVRAISVLFPVGVGLSLSNYYEGTDGENDAFGFASVGIKASVPPPLDSSWGSWTLSAGVQGLFLGDATSTFNEDEDAEVIGTVGVSVSF